MTNQKELIHHLKSNLISVHEGIKLISMNDTQAPIELDQLIELLKVKSLQSINDFENLVKNENKFE